MKNNKYYRDIRNYLFGSFAVKGIAFLAIPILTRLLSPGDYGEINIYTSIAGFLSILMMLGFNGALFNRYLKDKSNFNIYLGSNFIVLFFYIIIFVFFICYFSDSISKWLSTDRKVLLLAVLTAFLMVLMELYQSFLKAERRSEVFAYRAFAYTLLNLILSIVIIYVLTEKKYLGRIYGNIIALSVLGVHSLIYLKRITKIRFKKEYVFHAMFFGIPLVPHLLSQLILGNFDKIIINQLVGADATGVYSLAYNVGMITNFIAISINSAWTPVFYDDFKNNKLLKISRDVISNLKLYILSSFALILFAKEVVWVMASKEYFSAVDIVQYIIMGYVFHYMYTIYSMYATYNRRTLSFSVITIVAGLINIGLNYWLIPKFGYSIAAITTMFSYFLMFILHYLNARFILKSNVVDVNKVLLWLYVLIGFVVVFSVINKYLPTNWFLEITYKAVLLIIFMFVLFKGKALSTIKTFVGF